MKIKEKILEFIKVVLKVKTGQPTNREEIKRRIKHLEIFIENDEKTRAE